MSRPPIENGAVLLEGERIIAVDDYAAFEDTPGINREIGDSATWLLSGLINSHYHSGRSFQLGYSDDPGELGLFRAFSHVGLSGSHGAGCLRSYEHAGFSISTVTLGRDDDG